MAYYCLLKLSIATDKKTKGLLIGRDRKNIDNLKAIVGRYFKVEDIKVV